MDWFKGTAECECCIGWEVGLDADEGSVRLVKIDDVRDWDEVETWDVLSCGWIAVVMAKDGPSPRANMEGNTPEDAAPTEPGPGAGAGGEEVEVESGEDTENGGEVASAAAAVAGDWTDSTAKDRLDQIEAVFLLREPVAKPAESWCRRQCCCCSRCCCCCRCPSSGSV
jgi:hypothetical protein